MIYQTQKVVKDVKVILDQNMQSDALMLTGDVDTLTLDEIIGDKIEESVRRVHLTAPTHMLDGGHNFGDAIAWKDQCSGYVSLPDNFLRLVVFEMSDWERAVYTPITVDHPMYGKQRSRIKGIRGTAQRPVCAIASRGEGKVLEFYSCKSEDATVVQAVYLPEPKIDRGDGIEICERCYRAVLYTIAEHVAATIGDSGKIEIFGELAKASLQ